MLTITDTLQALTDGRMTLADVEKYARENIKRLEPDVQAFIYLEKEGLDREQPTQRGILSGIPIGVKDMIDVAGMPTTGGSAAYRIVPTADAEVVSALRREGALIFGKTNTQELAFGVVTPPTRNPLNLDYIPGGSSGGSAAAVAAGMVLGALGTDTGGSVRIPASCLGLVGFKPTVDVVSKTGVMSLSTTLDHVGFLTHSISDARLLFNITRKQDGAKCNTNDGRIAPQGRTGRLAVPRSYFAHLAHPEILAAFEDACAWLAGQGYTIVDIDIPPWSHWRRLQLTIRLPEAYMQHQAVLESEKRQLLHGDLAKRLERGRDISALSYLQAQRERTETIRAWMDRLSEFDALIMPTLVCPVPRIGQETVLAGGQTELEIWDALVCLTAPWNVLGFPAVTVPCGTDENGLPIGLQWIGRAYADDVLLHLAEQFERR